MFEFSGLKIKSSDLDCIDVDNVYTYVILELFNSPTLYVHYLNYLNNGDISERLLALKKWDNHIFRKMRLNLEPDLDWKDIFTFQNKELVNGFYLDIQRKIPVDICDKDGWIMAVAFHLFGTGDYTFEDVYRFVGLYINQIATNNHTGVLTRDGVIKLFDEVQSKAINRTDIKKILERLNAENNLEKLIKEFSTNQSFDSSKIKIFIIELLDRDNQKLWNDYKTGNKNSYNFIVGKVIKEFKVNHSVAVSTIDSVLKSKKEFDESIKEGHQ